VEIIARDRAEHLQKARGKGHPMQFKSPTAFI
jgi:hypothetical protein